ncbi:hypothetical protein BB561_004516 [Smittium simulii]|uniref:CCHC-type domain-containing protein n=1 Tax=Smittium simulii TaxID=133385 RepID=A0A2T9YFV7_9FUNG|nr:hypothetical protein BB561_004516 [Smittium simulii]
MSNVPGVIPSAAAEVPLTPAKRTRLDQKNDKISKNTKFFGKYQQNDKNNVKKIIDPSYNPQKFTELSVMHLLNDSKPNALKKASYGGSNKKIGCSWTQFTGNIDAAIDHVAISIDDEYVSYQHEKTAKTTYFMFYNKKSAKKYMNTPIYYNGIAVELYRTVTLEERTHIITITNTKNVNIKRVVEAVNNTFTKNGIIYDFSAYKNKKSGKFHTFRIKFLFKKTIDSFEIPTFLEIKNFFLALTYRGCKPVCIFCKQHKHCKSDCPELKKFKQNNKKHSKSALKINQNIVGLAPKSAMETTINTLFANSNSKISQEAVKKNKKQKDNTVKSIQNKIDNLLQNQ